MLIKLKNIKNQEVVINENSINSIIPVIEIFEDKTTMTNYEIRMNTCSGKYGFSFVIDEKTYFTLLNEIEEIEFFKK